MPMYDYTCPCGEAFLVFKKLVNLDSPTRCPKCGYSGTTRKISAPAILGDYPGYSCPITGDWIEGRKAHAENLAKHGCRVAEAGEREAAARFRADSDRKLEASIEKTVEREIAQMPGEKRDALAADLEHFDAQVVRV